MRLFLHLAFVICGFIQVVHGQFMRTVPFELLPSGHMVVKASIDGVTGRFIFDTGAGISVFSKSFFSKLPHKHLQDEVFTAFRATGERMDLPLYKVNDLVFGGYIKREEEISYLDINFGGFDGILSLKLLEQHPFTIDYVENNFILETPLHIDRIEKNGKVVPLQLGQYRGKALDIFADFLLNDSLHLQCALDCGAGKEVFKFNMRYMKRLGMLAWDTSKVKKHEKRSETDSSIRTISYVTHLSKIALKNAPSVKKNNIPAQFIDGLIYDGILSINWLGSKITFDIPRQEMIIWK